MIKANEDFSWLINARFFKRAGIGSLICIILSYIFTLPFFITPLFESESIIYVPLTILSQQLNQHGIGFGNEKEIDMYIQILKSNQMSDSLISKYNLVNEQNKKITLNKKATLYKKLSSKIEIEKTRYGSLSVKVKDADAKRASDMANDIVYFCELLKPRLLYANRLDALQFAKNLYEQKGSEIKTLKNKIDSLRYLNNSIAEKNDNDYSNLLTIYNLEINELISRKNYYEQEKMNFETPLPKAYVISKAVPKDAPTFPKRGLIIPAAVILYLFLFLIVEIIMHDIRKKTE